MAERVAPRVGARLLLSLRLFPLGCAVVVVSGLCVPSYLLLEPEYTAEQLSLVCLMAAFLGAVVLTAAVRRTARAFVGSHDYVRHCSSNGQETLVGESSPAWVVNDTRCLMALAGIVRPRVVISRDVVSSLQADELAAAVRHEYAHLVSRDNLKRVLILLAPEILPFADSFSALNRAWARLTEWAADDAAVCEDTTRSLSLAAALLRVARMNAGTAPSPLVSSLVAAAGDLPARIERLLGTPPLQADPSRWMLAGIPSAVLAFMGGAVAMAIQPATLRYVHQLLEHLMD